MGRALWIAGLAVTAGALMAGPARAQVRSVSPAEARLVAAVDSMTSTLAELGERHRGVAAAADSMAGLHLALSAGVEDLAARAEDLTPPDLVRAILALQKQSQSFSLRYLQLQQKMQQENRRFTLLSNIMKTKHDSVKNSIQNIR